MTHREKFEALIKERFGDCISLAICKNSDGDYAQWSAQVAWFAYQAALASQQPADDGWIEWAGGEDPSDMLVDVKFRDGDTSRDNASAFIWGHCDDEYDIIAYRVVKS